MLTMQRGEQILQQLQTKMAEDHRSSEIEQNPRNSRTKSILGSFKMVESVLGPGNNKKVVNLNIPGIKLIDKDQYKKQQICQVCFVGFGKLTRQHHCRVCANAVCSSCSASSINKQRCCDVCAYKYSNLQKQTIKSNIIFELEGAASMLVSSRNALQQELKKINQEATDIDASEKSIESSQRKIAELQKQLQEMKKNKAHYEQQIAQIEG